MGAGPTPEWITKTRRSLLNGVVRRAKASRVAHSQKMGHVQLYGTKGIVGEVRVALQRASNGEACAYLTGYSVGPDGVSVPFNSLTREGWEQFKVNTRLSDI